MCLLSATEIASQYKTIIHRRSTLDHNACRCHPMPHVSSVISTWLALPSCCWDGLIVNSCRHSTSFGTMFLTRNASMWPGRKTAHHGCRMSLAEGSDGCQLVSALANLWRIGAYNGSRPWSTRNTQQHRSATNQKETALCGDADRCQIIDNHDL